jgi:phage-related protein (TIGR01555 family)
LIHFPGAEIPYWQRIAENYWDISVLEPCWDRMLAFDSTTQGAAQLIYKAHLRTVKVKGLRELMGTNAAAFTVIQKFFNAVRVMQSNEGFTLLDGNDEYQVDSYSFAGLADMMTQFGQQLAGSSDIPMVRFFAQSPSGMNATGESDWRNYYDGIKARLEKFRPAVELIYGLLYRSTLGREPKKPVTLVFKPLWQLNDQESSEITAKTVTAVSTLVDKGIYDRSMALKEIRQLSTLTGFGSKITDDDIKQAEEDAKMARENPPDVISNPEDPTDIVTTPEHPKPPSARLQ